MEVRREPSETSKTYSRKGGGEQMVMEELMAVDAPSDATFIAGVAVGIGIVLLIA
jgi:hypothetical protein